MDNIEDDFGMMESSDAEFHHWAIENEFGDDIEIYEAAEAAWIEAKGRCLEQLQQSEKDKAELVELLTGMCDGHEYSHSDVRKFIDKHTPSDHKGG